MLYSRSLLEIAPTYYYELLESFEIFSAEDKEFSLFYENLSDVLSQFRVSTATWGLFRWEEFVGIPYDSSKTIEERRSNIRAKLRGYGTVTAEHIKSICESYSRGTVAVTEDNANYNVVIKFIDTLGEPENVEDLKNILRDILPAHLTIEYEFLYNTYKQYSPIPYSELSQFTYEELLNLDWVYNGSTNTALRSKTNEELEVNTNNELLGGFTIV